MPHPQEEVVDYRFYSPKRKTPYPGIGIYKWDQPKLYAAFAEVYRNWKNEAISDTQAENELIAILKNDSLWVKQNNSNQKMKDCEPVPVYNSFIKLHIKSCTGINKNPDEVYINPKYITSFNLNADKITQVMMSDGSRGYYGVKETPEEIIEIIAKHERGK